MNRLPQRPQVRIGGSFAPPLTDELLSQYESLINSTDPRSPVGSALRTCLSCCKEWWNLPDPTHKNGSALHLTGRGVIHWLDDEHRELLWNHIPWAGQTLEDGSTAPNELEAISQTFHQIESDAATRNGQAADNWKQTVALAITAKHFPEPGLYQTLTRAFKSAGVWLRLLPDSHREHVKAQFEKMRQCDEEIALAISTKTYESIPYPTPEPTPLRNCAFHLLWFVRELDLDREPLTSDQLFKGA